MGDIDGHKDTRRW